jgi:hypothetical protein
MARAPSPAREARALPKKTAVWKAPLLEAK